MDSFKAKVAAVMGWAHEVLEIAGSSPTRDELIAIGRKCLSLGSPWLSNAVQAFDAAEDKDGLIAVGLHCVSEGHLYLASVALRAAGQGITAEQCRMIGDKCLEQDRLVDAVEAYRLALDADGMAAVGRRYVEKNEVALARKSFEIARRFAALKRV